MKMNINFQFFESARTVVSTTHRHEVPLAPPLGELLSAAKLRGCTMMIGAHLRFAPHL